METPQSQLLQPVAATRAGRPESLDDVVVPVIAPKALLFSVGGNACLDQDSRIREIIPVPAICSVPGTHPWFLGLAGISGELLPVTDLARWCGYQRMPASHAGADKSRLLVIENDTEAVGLVVDSVQGFVDVPLRIQVVDSSNKRMGSLVTGSADNAGRLALMVILQRLFLLDAFRNIGLPNTAKDDFEVTE